MTVYIKFWGTTENGTGDQNEFPPQGGVAPLSRYGEELRYPRGVGATALPYRQELTGVSLD